jgi:hypothetical protein
MNKKRFCCEASSGMYEDYYRNQIGSGLPVFEGSRGQRGHGLGSMLSGLFRSAMPMIKRGLAFFGKHALKTGLEVANDVADGQTFRDSAQRRIPEGIKRLAENANFSNQSGSGRVKSYRRKRSKSSSSKKKKKRTSRDIFA